MTVWQTKDDAVALSRLETRLELALGAARLGAWEYEIDTRMLTSTPQCKANHGFRSDADMQLDAHIVPAVHETHRARFLQAIEQAIATRGSFEIEVPHQWPDGTDHWLLVAGQVVEPNCIVGVSQDISERHRTEDELRDSERRKDEFLAVLGHELRGPLAAILMAVRLLELKGPPEPELQKVRETIRRQTMQLAKLVDDLLDVGRITAGKLRLDRERVDLRAVMKHALEASGPLIERRRHTLNVALPDSPLYVDADAARLAQVACNLLNNAAKYMSEGGQIDVNVEADDSMAVVRVRDRGVGIPVDMLERIFERFVQVGPTDHRPAEGLGIGLSVVKALVELHGGTVDASSGGPGEGAQFTFRIPLASATG
jgi:two-component system CheB/CheR fusion protein